MRLLKTFRTRQPFDLLEGQMGSFAMGVPTANDKMDEYFPEIQLIELTPCSLAKFLLLNCLYLEKGWPKTFDLSIPFLHSN